MIKVKELLELIENIKYLKENTNYLDDINYLDIIKSSNYMDYKLNKNILYNYVDKRVIDGIYEGLNLTDENEVSISDIMTILSNYFDDETREIYAYYINDIKVHSEDLINNLPNYIDIEILNNIKDYINANSRTYNSVELANLLGIDKTITNNIYNLIKLVNNNTDDWVLSRLEFVEHLFNNKEYLDNEQITKLELLQTIMNSILNNTKYNYIELSNLLNMDSEKIKNIFAINKYYNEGLDLSPNEVVKFVISHKDDELLKNNLVDKLDRIYLVNKIFNSVLNNDSYNYLELANFLNIDSNKLRLLYGLYDTLHNETYISVYSFTNFIVNDVLNSEYSSYFSDKDKDDIITINGIINSSLNNIKYTKDEMIAILSKLSPNINKDTVYLLYMYYGSNNLYDDNYTLTIEKMVNYLNNDIITDYRFDDFISDNMKDRIINSKERINDAKDLLVGDNYSRMIIITDLTNESKDTFKFIENTRVDLKSINDKYLIGNSPMAYDISKSFNSEFNFISLLTLISIFVVVAITFRSIISPLIISLIIECSVYVTMGILAFQGEPVYFISLLVVQSILMGATIDYGIVYTSYYLENRKKYDVSGSISKSYRKSSHTILTSGTILILVTFTIGIFADGVTSKICMTLSKGTLCSVLLIMLILPGVIAALDKIIIRKNR